MDIVERLWRVTYQVFTPIDGIEKKVSRGSGFLLRHKNHLFFLTADHVIHYNEYANKQEITEKRVLYVENNVQIEEKNVITRFSDFYHCDPREQGRDDFAFCIIEESLQFPFKTEAFLREDGAVIIPADLEKLVISSEETASPRKEDSYSVAGCTYTAQGTRRVNTLHLGMQLIGVTDAYVILKSQEGIIKEKWEGLSGAPVLNQDGQLVGILVSTHEVINTILLIPIEKVLAKIDEVVDANS